MGQPGLSAEQIIRQHIEPAVKAAGGALQAAQSANPGDPTVALALVSLGLLEHFLNRIVARLADQEVAERVAVYQVVTEACVKSLVYPASDVFAAVLRLCGEQDQGLTGDLPGPDPEILKSLSTALLRVTVTYDADPGKPTDRRVQVFLHEAGTQQVRETMSTARLPWESTPEDVREQAIRRGHRTVAFTLYPREGH